MIGTSYKAIAPILEARGIRLDAASVRRIERYVELLEHWNRRINLVGTHDVQVMWHRHILDCLLLESFGRNPSSRRWLDAGSGAGLPGVLMAIVHPDWHIAAAERVARKATFLREVARTLALGNLTVLREDVHRLHLAPTFAPYDGLVARAFAPLAELLALARTLLRPGGELWAMKGRRWQEEAAQVPSSLLAAFHPHPQVHSYRLTDSEVGDDGFVLVYRRYGDAVTEA